MFQRIRSAPKTLGWAAGGRTQAGGVGAAAIVREVALPAAMFSLNVALSNVGLLKVDADLHVLLRASEVIWLLLAALLVQRERVGGRAVALVLASAFGAGLVSWDASEAGRTGRGVSSKAIIINLGAAAVAGVQIVALRRNLLKYNEIP